MKARAFFISIIILAGTTRSLGRIKPTFRVLNKDATMPVVVRGNVASNVLILFLHGGPGGTAMTKIGTRAFDALEVEYAMVYWDQRGADASSGGTQRKWMNLNQYVEDLDVVIDKLKNRYPESLVFLMGHCWGGGFGTAYLIDKTRQAKIAGWIDVAGAHNNPKGDSLSVVWVKDHAMQMIASGKDVRYWVRALQWYRNNPSITSDQLGHYSFVRRSQGYQLIQGDSLGRLPCYTKKDLLLRPATFLFYYANYYRTLSSFLISDIDLTPEMHNIKVPSLIIWGEKDGLIPLKMAYEAYHSLGAGPGEKRLVTLPNTAHTVFYEQPVLFTAAVMSFIEYHKSAALQPLAWNSVSF